MRWRQADKGEEFALIAFQQGERCSANQPTQAESDET